MDLVRDVFGDSSDASDSDADGAGAADADARCAREAYGRPPVSFLAAAGRWRRTLPLRDRARGATLARGVLTDDAMAWLLRAIASDGLIDSAAAAAAGAATGAPRRNQAMRFGDFPPWAAVLSERVEALARREGEGDDDDRRLMTSAAASSRPAPMFDQMILNSYLPGEGLRAHVDLDAFDDGVVVASLESAIMMDFYPPPPPDPAPAPDPNPNPNTNDDDATGDIPGGDGDVPGDATRRARGKRDDDDVPIQVWLQPGDVLFLCEDARWTWRHGIAARSHDVLVSEDGESARRVERGHRTSVTLRKMRHDAHELRVAA